MLSGDPKRRFLRKMFYVNKRCVVSELFPLFKGPGRAYISPYGRLWAHMDLKNQKKYVKKFVFIGAFKGPCTLP